MKLTVRQDLGGYGLETLAGTCTDGTVVDKPFLLVTGPNGSGKSAVLRGIRASLALEGERMGRPVPLRRASRNDGKADPGKTDPGRPKEDLGRLATQRTDVLSGRPRPLDHVPAVFDVDDLGWEGQPTYLFDSRAVSGLVGRGSFGDDMLYHVSMIAGGGARASHGQFVGRTWREAVSWAVGSTDLDEPWGPKRTAGKGDNFRERVLGRRRPSTERWLLVDEPETAIDAEALLVGLSAIIAAAEIGRLRVFCASHSLLFAAGLARHDKVQVLDLGPEGSWLRTQEIALSVAADTAKLDAMGQDIMGRIRNNARHG